MINNFTGFSKESLIFLKTVKKKNSKEWFEKNRDTYEKHLLEPFRYLVAELGGDMHKIDPGFEVRPQINKTISKIYRDTRFSKDKSIFKKAMWLTFKRRSKDWKEAPAYFFELMTDSYRYGLGYYSASRGTMDVLREAINNNPKAFLKVISFYGKQSELKLIGDKYKRELECDHPQVIQDWYQRKSFYLVKTCRIDKTVFSSRLKVDVAECFKVLGPLYKYLYQNILIKS